MKRTDKFQLAYFEQDDVTSAIEEMQRWITLDAQLTALFSIMGDGVLDGWDILAGAGLSITVTAGSGHVDFIAVQTEADTLVTNLTPNARNYMYAQLTEDSYWTQNVDFASYAYADDLRDGLYIGYVDTDDVSITAVNIQNRQYLGFIGLIREVIASHRHIGGSGNPEPVNLGTDVQGVLNQRNLPDLDASILKSGVLDADRIPLIDHITKLVNQGTLTHAQLDAYIESLNLVPSSMMGEVSTINLLQLLLAVKHVYPEIDEYMVNEIAFIPGISPDSFVDFENTTASVDTRPYAAGGSHIISGIPSPARKIYTKTWDTEVEFSSGDNDSVYMDGDTVSLSVTEDQQILDNFGVLDGWAVTTVDLSSISTDITQDTTQYVVPPASGKLTIEDNEVEIALIFNKTISAQDWSDYDYIVFYLKTDSVQHGDVYFYFNDVLAGTQQSYTKVLERNAPTIDTDTLEIGWQRVIVDISSYTRTAINTMGFYISTQSGWDSSKGFDLRMDHFYLSTGNLYEDDGYFRVIFGGDFLYEFWRVRWDAIVPSDVESSGIVLKSRTRVGNSLFDLQQAVWSSYAFDSGYEIALPTENMYRYIEVEMYFGASDSRKRSAFLRRLYLDFYTSDVDNAFEFDTQDDWESGTLFNLDTTSLPGSMLIKGVDEIGNIYYGTQGATSEINSEMVELYRVSGSMAPRSTYQVINDEPPTLGLVTGVARGDSGSYWVTDIDNDRVIKFGKDGRLQKALYGSFLTPPLDPYGDEEAGPGSNQNADVIVATTLEQEASGVLTPLHSIYNPTEGILYVIFDENLENIYSSTKSFKAADFYLSVGSHIFTLGGSEFHLMGVDQDKYELWSAFNGSPYVQQFKFSSHVLKIVLSDVDRTFMSHMVDDQAPSIVMLSPYANEVMSNNPLIKFVTYNFVVGSQSGTNHIQYSIDGGVYHDLYASQVQLSGLSNGQHILRARLVNADDSLNTNIEASMQTSFLVGNVAGLTEPYVQITSPRPHQIYSSSPVMIEFETPNFSILPEGHHLRYILDTESPVDYYTDDPITLDELDNGLHTIRLQLVSRDGVTLPYSYATCTTDFIVGLNSKAIVNLHIAKNAIKSQTEKSVPLSLLPVDVGEIVLSNIYAPIDIQILPPDASSSGETDVTLLIAKMRSPSWTNGLGGVDNLREILRRVADSTTTTTTVASSGVTTTTTTLPSYAEQFVGINDEEVIYGTKYLDGHSVVQMTTNGEIVLSNNAAKFATTKNEAKLILGSAEKIGENELLIADALQKRAIVTYTNLDTQTPEIVWRFDSDRYISDFHIVVQDEVIVSIYDDAVRESSLYVRQGTSVIWENKSSSPVYVYSGTTSYSQFYADPDLNLYGDDFKSGILYPGDRYIFKFMVSQQYDWFTYPGILTGTVNVTRNRISERDEYIILENDRFPSPFTSRVIRVDAWGNVVWAFGESYLVQPKDARPLLNGGVIIST